jgi:hypothetical protein
MLMVQVRIMGVPMYQPLVPVDVAVRLARRHTGAVAVLVVFIVHVPVLMLNRLMDVLVIVALAEMQPESHPH